MTKEAKTSLFDGLDDPEAVPGVATKACYAKGHAPDDSDMAKINAYALEPLKAEDVFTFKVMAGDNELDDRNHAPYDMQALKDLAGLYAGKTMIFDHERSAHNQKARIYDSYVVEDPSKGTGAGEPHGELWCKAYMLRTESNKDLIAEVAAGIKKEVSTSMRPKACVCSICGTDNLKSWCSHWPGRTYSKEDEDGNTADEVCLMMLKGASEAYELSFVAVPAQPRAGTSKSCHGFAKCFEAPQEAVRDAQEPDTGAETEKTCTRPEKEKLALKSRLNDAYVFTEKGVM